MSKSNQCTDNFSLRHVCLYEFSGNFHLHLSTLKDTHKMETLKTKLYILLTCSSLCDVFACNKLYSENHNQFLSPECFSQSSYQIQKHLLLSTFNVLSHQMANRNTTSKIKSLKVPAAIQRLLFYTICKKNCCFWLS